MAAGDLTTQSLTAAAGESQPGFLAKAISAVVGKVFFSAVTNRKPAVLATALRTALASADSAASTFASYTASKIDAGMSMHVDLSCRFSAASQSATVFLILFDGAGTVMGHTPDINFTAESAYLIDTGIYGAPKQLVDIGAASYYYPILRTAPASGTVDLHGELL